MRWWVLPFTVLIGLATWYAASNSYAEEENQLESKVRELTKQIEQLTERVKLLELEIQALKALLVQKTSPVVDESKKKMDQSLPVPSIASFMSMRKYTAYHPLENEYQPQLEKLKREFLTYNQKMPSGGLYADFNNANLDLIRAILLGITHMESVNDPSARFAEFDANSYPHPIVYLGIGYIHLNPLNNLKLDRDARVRWILKEVVFTEILPKIDVFGTNVKFHGIVLFVGYLHKNPLEEGSLTTEKDEAIQVWIPYEAYSTYMRNEITDQELINRSAVMLQLGEEQPPARIQVSLKN